MGGTQRRYIRKWFPLSRITATLWRYYSNVIVRQGPAKVAGISPIGDVAVWRVTMLVRRASGRCTPSNYARAKACQTKVVLGLKTVQNVAKNMFHSLELSKRQSSFNAIENNYILIFSIIKQIMLLPLSYISYICIKNFLYAKLLLAQAVIVPRTSLSWRILTLGAHFGLCHLNL